MEATATATRPNSHRPWSFCSTASCPSEPFKAVKWCRHLSYIRRYEASLHRKKDRILTQDSLTLHYHCRRMIPCRAAHSVSCKQWRSYLVRREGASRVVISICYYTRPSFLLPPYGGTGNDLAVTSLTSFMQQLKYSQLTPVMGPCLKFRR